MRLNLKLLNYRLCEFGLNPSDWCVEVRSKRGPLAKLDVWSKSDSPLHFEGWATGGNWLRLVIAEL